jgi:hypothetical protein
MNFCSKFVYGQAGPELAFQKALTWVVLSLPIFQSDEPTYDLRFDRLLY